MLLFISSKELKKALKDIKIAEKNGFNFCLANFDVLKCHDSFGNLELKYTDLLERGSENDPRFNWGRFQDVTKNNKFVNNKLVKIKNKE